MRDYRSFKEAREFVRSLKFTKRDGTKGWRAYCKSGKKPDDIPAGPDQVYKNKGWVSFGDWLGTGVVAKQKPNWRSFTEARKFVHTLKLKDVEEWKKYYKSGKKPADIPTNPFTSYKKEFVNYVDWLGTDKKTSDRNFKSFEDAKKYVQKFGFKNIAEYRKWCENNKPADIPYNPNRVYKNKGWISMGDWLGTGYIAPKNRKYRSFEETKKFAQSLKLSGQKEWGKFLKSGKKPDDIPTSPSTKYKKEWKGWGDFLGTENKSILEISKNYLPWKDAKPIYRKLSKEYEISGWGEWVQFARTHKKLLNDLRIPATPWSAYTKEREWKRRKMK